MYVHCFLKKSFQQKIKSMEPLILDNNRSLMLMLLRLVFLKVDSEYLYSTLQSKAISKESDGFLNIFS